MKQFQVKSRFIFSLAIAAILGLSACEEAQPPKAEVKKETVQKEDKKTTPAPAPQVAPAQTKQKETVSPNAYSTNVSGYEDRFIGNPDAPVTLIEYASYTCPHCASFHNDILPSIKKDFVETGKVKVIFRDFPFEQIGATAAMLSRCVDPARYAGFNELLMKQQENWAHSNDPMSGLFKLAKLAGLSQDKIDSCLSNEKLLDDIIAVRKEAMDKYGFNSTPSFLINGEKVVGSGEYEKFKNIIESKL